MNTSVNTYSIEQLQVMMADLINSQKETDLKFKEIDKQIQEIKELLVQKSHSTDEPFQEMLKEFSGIKKSNTQIAEDYFSAELLNRMSVGKFDFDYIDFFFTRKRKNIKANYDIVLYNDTTVLVLEVKYLLQKEHLRKFYEGSLKNFHYFSDHYKKHKLFGGVAALSFEKGAKEEAEKYGFYVLTQNNKQFHIANSEDFQPKEIK